MAMSDLKTKATDASVEAYLGAVADESRRQDCRKLLAIMKRITRSDPKMWGESIVGFGSYHYKYASGREGDWFLTGFAPRKQDLTIHIMSGFDRHADLMGKLGKHKTGKSCLYVKRLADLDLAVLETLIAESVKQMKQARS